MLDAAQVTKLDEWLRSVLWESQLPDPAGGPKLGGRNDPASFEIHRTKGRLVLKDGSVNVLQGVRELFEIFEAPESSPAEEAAGEPTAAPASSKLILIGRRLGQFDFEKSVLSALEK